MNKSHISIIIQRPNKPHSFISYEVDEEGMIFFMNFLYLIEKKNQIGGDKK